MLASMVRHVECVLPNLASAWRVSVREGGRAQNEHRRPVQPNEDACLGALAPADTVRVAVFSPSTRERQNARS